MYVYEGQGRMQLPASLIHAGVDGPLMALVVTHPLLITHPKCAHPSFQAGAVGGVASGACGVASAVCS